MEWKYLLSPKRSGMYTNSGNNKKKSMDLRSEFEKDYHRIIGSASFRRLQDKTQVFPLDKSDFIRTRLTHSLEVSSLAKSLGQNISNSIMLNIKDESFTYEMKDDVCNILQCAGLIHDIGNPPFGHFGEEAIRNWFSLHLEELKMPDGTSVEGMLTEPMKQDFYHFEGNSQALRLVAKLHFLVNENGMNLTYGLLNTIIKYPGSSLEINPHSGNCKDKKMGYFQSEKELYEDIAQTCHTKGLRHPLTFILEAADDIAYRTADIEDAFKKGCFNYDTLLKELRKYVQDTYPVQILEHQYEKAVKMNIDNPELYAVQNWMIRLQGYLIYSATESFTNHYQEIMMGSYPQDLFTGTDSEMVMKALGKIAYDYAFTSMPILKLEIAADTMLTYLLDKMVPAAIQYDSGQTMGMMERKMLKLISENYIQIYHFHAKGESETKRLYLRMMLVTDYISGMTDSFAKNLYQEMNGITS
ncbi:MAG: deoxyguanosinetriphosphate triphosphohydrolase [Lachnospiraceae bacterium]|nr:deoxyguanosinetriphosphate triphosphohydrolase [Lachnospiraceae bacterium]MDD3615067.1 deoxyguanosinetriphosphate triphosphohydrolase [Lachnospiraceae bacterium]